LRDRKILRLGANGKSLRQHFVTTRLISHKRLLFVSSSLGDDALIILIIPCEYRVENKDKWF
jgi:hypothetical protein